MTCLNSCSNYLSLMLWLCYMAFRRGFRGFGRDPHKSGHLYSRFLQTLVQHTLPDPLSYTMEGKKTEVLKASGCE